MITVIAGAGLMGRFHADAARRAGAQIIAVADPDVAAARHLARRYAGCVTAPSLAEALARTKPDVVHVCAPEATHHSLALEIAAAGAHALIEKPIVPTVAEADDLLARFRDAGRFIIPAHQYAFQRAIDASIARTRTLGSLRRIQFDIRSAGAIAAMRDAVAATILPHPLSIVQRIFPVAEFEAAQWTLARAAPGEWLVTTVVQAAIVTIAISLSGRPTRFSTTLVAAGGTIDIDNFNGLAIAAGASASRLHKVASPFGYAFHQFGGAGINLAGRIARREFAYVGLQTLIAGFYRAIRSGNSQHLPITPADIRANVNTCASITAQIRRLIDAS